VAVGRQIPHPNKTEHHIAWIDVYFRPEGEKFPYQVGKAEFDWSVGQLVVGDRVRGAD